ncbi:MAG: DUF1553 domain-containing protein [Planctomyces sp.]|nr:DUF1553 domain-containing protein [Planctomyces sp.]
MTSLPLFAVLLPLACGSPPADPGQIAARIDARIDERLAADQVVAASDSEDFEFYRRLSLDLTGRIPTADETRAFLDDSSEDRRAAAIDRLLASPRHAAHFANVWRSILLPEADADRQVRYLQPGFEAWLRDQRQARRSFDGIVRDLLTVPIVGPDQPPQLVLKDLQAANPIAFIASKEADPGKLAAASTRVFLGLRMECAQCHDHPFDRWTREQFWNQAAFFSGLQRKGRGTFAPLIEDPAARSIPIMDVDAVAPALFLTGETPDAGSPASGRTALADWITRADNPWFARAIVNRVWAQLMGVGLVDPVDDFQELNPPSHPELLDELAQAFASSGFDLDLLYRGICLSRAYQRTSRLTDPSQSEARLFARANLKAMSGDQFADSLLLAAGVIEPDSAAPLTRSQDGTRRRLLDLVAAQGADGEPQTSVAQTLLLMNGRNLTGGRAPATTQTPDGGEATAEEAIEQLYLRTLSRRPRADERTLIEDYLAAAPAEGEPPLADILWMLLNSAEFQWNH